MNTENLPPRRGTSIAALAVLLGGVSAALHVGKLPPAMLALQSALGIGLVASGFMLSLVQVAGMTLGLAVGLASDTLGLRRCMMIGLTLLVSASALGACVQPGPQALTWLLLLRALEGMGFLLTVMPGPALIRRHAPAGAEKAVLGLWGAYMPFGVAAALLLGPILIGAMGWRGWWGLMAAFSALAALGLRLWVPPDTPPAHHATGQPSSPWRERLRKTWAARGPRALGLAFAVYSSQWMAVIGFLPSIYAQAGIAATWTALLTAGAAAMNIVGNLAGGRLLQSGVAPQRLLRWGFAMMALGTVAAFIQWGQGAETWRLPALWRYVAVCMFSLCGGMIPATLFTLAVRLAPSPSTVSTTVGLMQQASSFGQFVAPPLVAWLAHQVGGWQWTWIVTGAFSLIGIAVAMRLEARPERTLLPSANKL